MNSHWMVHYDILNFRVDLKSKIANIVQHRTLWEYE